MNVINLRARMIREENRVERMSDAELDLEALKRARTEVLADANQAALEMSLAQQRMDRHLLRAEQLKKQIEAATVLLAARNG